MYSHWRMMLHPRIFAYMAIAFAIAIRVSIYADDYIRDISPSSLAKAHFHVVPDGLSARRVARDEVQKHGENEAYYTEDGSISIPPRAMVTFKMNGKCMDPKLPAPASGEPMQFVAVEKLIPPRLQDMYAELMRRLAQKDPEVLENNPQHLVWAIRTAGTDSPLADNLSEAQLALLDKCAGRRKAFLKYHEKTKKRNARKKRRSGGSSSGNTITVGGLSYDASELTGANGGQRIEAHISALIEMGNSSKTKTESDFRYGEIEEELYSDVISGSGLSFSARILNASEHRKEVNVSNFAAQVGNGKEAGKRRQRVTMAIPPEFDVIANAVPEGADIVRNVSAEEIDGELNNWTREKKYGRRSTRIGEAHTSTEQEKNTTVKTKIEEHTTIDVIPPVPPVPPVEPVNNIIKSEDDASIRVVSIEYDMKTRQGMLVVETVAGSFKDVTKYIRKNLDELVKRNASLCKGGTIPAGNKLKIDSIMVNDKDFCEVKFSVK